jgi:glutamine amidotransferase
MSTVVVDVGTGNLHSVRKAIEHVAADERVIVSARAADLTAADRVVFPGQGAMGTCMSALEERGLREPLLRAIDEKPVLGICLGLQVLFESSEEDGGTPGLGVFPGQVRGFASLLSADQATRDRMREPLTGRALKIPHMGWNQVHQLGEHPLWANIPQDSRFYFVHSYYADNADQRDIAGATEYGVTFTAAAARDNIFAVQFHPEKSQHAGLMLLSNFIKWRGGG